MTDTVDPAPRRRWLVRTLEGGISATLVALLYPVVRFLRPRAATETGAMEMVAPYRMNALNPDAEGRAPAPFDFGGRPCLLVKTGENTVKAFNALCTHTDCTVEYRPGKGDIFCACHNGVYNLDGQNVSGPPPRPLQEYKVALRGKEGQEEIIVSRTD